jgi:hypothetical protein
VLRGLPRERQPVRIVSLPRVLSRASALSELTRGELTGFAGDVEALVGQHGIWQVILDLRLNGGGDNTTYGPLLEVLERATQELGKRLRVLIGRSTSSSTFSLSAIAA